MGNPLVAFALVAEEYERSGDPLIGLKPLFAPILAGKVGQPFNSDKFAESFKSLYGLAMTPFVANALAERLSEMGLLKRVVENHREKYFVADFQWLPESIEEAQIDSTVKLFVRWATPKMESAGRAFNDQELEDAFLLRLSRPEFASIFSDSADDPEKKNRKLKGLLGLGAIDPSVKNGVYLDYLVADFVLNASLSAPEVFDVIAKISYGSLLADAATGLASSVPKTEISPPLRVVLDGPLILDMLDLNTPEHRTYAEGLLAMIKEAGLMVAVFDHSIDEMRNTIKSTLRAHSAGIATGPLAERFRTTPGYTIYANTIMNSLESKVKGLDIVILRSGLYEEARYKKYFPDERVDRVRNAIGDLHAHLDARVRDAMSVATVARLKGEKKYADSVLESGTIFVTRNTMLVRRVLAALSVSRSEPDPRFTIATDGQIAGVLWFVTGIAAGFELSRKRLVANCSSAVLPKKEVVVRMAEILGGLSEELKDEFETLMTDRRASLCPMRVSIGVVEAIDAEKSLKALQLMRDELAAPAVARAEAAELVAEESKAELARIAADGKEVAITLQELLSKVSADNEATISGFDSQLAQMTLDLERADDRLRAVSQDSTESRKALVAKIGLEKQGLNRRQLIVAKMIDGLFILAALVIGLVSILLPDYEAGVIRWGLALIVVISLAFVKNILEKVRNRIVGRLFAVQRGRISAWEEALELMPRGVEQ